MKFKAQGYASAQAVFDVLNGSGVLWGEPTQKGDSWHVFKLQQSTEQQEQTKQFLLDCFPKIRFSFN